MRVLVTGSNGKVGRAAVRALIDAGHEVVASDVQRGAFESPDAREPRYVRADLTDAGAAFAVVRDAEAVVHAGAIPDPSHDVPHVVFRNNVMATFNAIEAAVRFGVRRFVNVSSATVLGIFYPERDFLPDYLPMDEEHPLRPQDPYALSKLFGEELMDAAVRRSDIRCVSLRASWVQWEGNYERNLGPQVREPDFSSPAFGAYIDAYDLADAIRLAVESDLPGHEAFYIASPDNVPNLPLAEQVRARYGDRIEIRELPREDASPLSTTKAEQLLGWTPTRSWSDYLDAEGRLRPGIEEPA